MFVIEEAGHRLSFQGVAKRKRKVKMAKEETKETVAWELFYWQYGDSTCFSAKLFDLLCKADPNNLIRLGKGFPFHFELFLEWRESTPKEFFNRYGINHETTGRHI